LNGGERPTTLAQAIAALAASPGLLPVAGCTDLMVAPAMKRAEVEGVLDLLAIPELRGIREVAGGLEIGAAVSFSAIAASPLVAAWFPALRDAASQVGGWQIQNRATLGGNLANASPAGDSLPVLMALDATVIVAGPRGWREIAHQDFHVGYRRTALEPDELIARVRLPRPAAGSRQAFRKVGTRQAQAISKVAVAMLGLAADGEVRTLRLAAASVAATPVRLRAAEEAAVGRPVADAAERAARSAAASVAPIDDVRSTAEYRRHALAAVVRRLVLGLGGG
jgi:CO/xanthine dehydrogenase FAD-binding subunit